MNELYLIIAGVVALLAGLFAARASGKKAERNEQLKRDVGARRKANESDKEVDSLSTSDIRARANRWLRNK